MHDIKTFKQEFAEFMLSIFPYENKKLKIGWDGASVFAKTDFGRYEYFFTLSDGHHRGYLLDPCATIGFKDIFRLYEKFEDIKLGSDYSHLLWRMSDFTKNTGIATFKITDATDMNDVREQIQNFYQTVETDFFSKFKCNEDLDKYLNTDPYESKKWCMADYTIYTDALIVAKVTNNPAFKSLAKNYRQLRVNKYH